MFRLIKRIHEKPEPARRRIAFGIALAITLIIFLVWLSTLPAKLRNSQHASNPRSEAASPIETLKESVGSLFGALSFE